MNSFAHEVLTHRDGVDDGVLSVSSVRVTLNGPVAAVLDTESFSLMVGSASFWWLRPSLADTTVTPGLVSVHGSVASPVRKLALVSNPVPETTVAELLALLHAVLENGR